MTAEAEHQPVTAVEADQAFASLERFNTLLLAVSGGPDSLALLVLVAEWRKKFATLKNDIVVVTVDHGLREASAREAAFVSGIAAASGVRHVTLRWEDDKPTSGIPNAARTARYALLDGYARSINGGQSVAVLTAHHQDDQAETVFMRLMRGGGVDALAAMRVERALQEGSPARLIRPLLDFPKARLIATLQNAGVQWIEDPTNSDTQFERAAVRQTLAVSGVTAAALARTARRMREAADGLDYAAANFAATLGLSFPGGVSAHIDRQAFDAGPMILRQRVLRDLIALFGGATPPPEMLEIENLSERIRPHQDVRATLGGATISAGLRSVRVWRELGRINTAGLALQAGVKCVWDGRFRVGYDCDADTAHPAISVRLLGDTGLRAISEDIPASRRTPAPAAQGLPAFWAGDTLLAVPALGVLTDAGKRLPALRLTCDPIRAAALDT